MDLSNTLKRIIYVTAAFFVWTAYAEGGVVIDAAIQDKLKAAVAKPQRVYPLDLAQNQQTFERIDQWAGTLIDLSQTEPKRIKKERKVYWIETSVNTPIALGKSGKKIEPEKPFRIKYVQMPQKRALVKTLRIPSEKTLSDQTAANIGKEFIATHQFIRVTPQDAIKDQVVVNRRCKPIESTTQSNPKALTIQQRVIFKRAFNGLEVLNSRQIVDIHPDSGEILAYKSINWTPVEENKGSAAAYKRVKDIVREITKAFEKKPGTVRVDRIKAGMFQTDKRLFPVIAVYTAPQAGRDQMMPIQRVLYISLAKDIDLPAPKSHRTLPTTASAQ